MSKLSGLIAEINKAGFLVVALYQTSPEEWVCALRPKGKFSTVQGRASTLRGALRDAWTNKCHDSLFDPWDFRLEEGKLVNRTRRRPAPASRERVKAK